jgi:hypothetical protein
VWIGPEIDALTCATVVSLAGGAIVGRTDAPCAIPGLARSVALGPGGKPLAPNQRRERTRHEDAIGMRPSAFGQDSALSLASGRMSETVLPRPISLSTSILPS